MADTGFFKLVYEAVKKIPCGRVTTYGAIACAIGFPRMSRYVGYDLHVNPEPGIIPCHRVVNRFGCVSPAFAFGGENVQTELLLKENVEVVDGKVDLSKYLFTF